MLLKQKVILGGSGQISIGSEETELHVCRVSFRARERIRRARWV